MPELTPQVAGDVARICQEQAEAVAAAFARGLGFEAGVSVGEPGTLDTASPPEELDGPGLAILITAKGGGVLLGLPERGSLLPDWCAHPDSTGQSKLTTLAQELGTLLLPDGFELEKFAAVRVENLGQGLMRGMPLEGAALVPLELEGADGARADGRLVWPLADPAAVLGIPAADETPPSPPPAEPPPRPRTGTVRDLPGFSRSLLRIRVPVKVTLAEKRQPLARILELGPGSIIQFDKSCDKLLDLDVGDTPIATGEAVKVGDKFGLQIHSIILPEERFRAVRGTAAKSA